MIFSRCPKHSNFVYMVSLCVCVWQWNFVALETTFQVPCCANIYIILSQTDCKRLQESTSYLITILQTLQTTSSRGLSLKSFGGDECFICFLPIWESNQALKKWLSSLLSHNHKSCQSFSTRLGVWSEMFSFFETSQQKKSKNKNEDNIYPIAVKGKVRGSDV